MKTNNALKEANRKRIPDRTLVRIALMLMVLMILFGCGHYLWHRITKADIEIANLKSERTILLYEVEDAERYDVLQEIHCQRMMREEKYSLSLIPFDEGVDLTMDFKDGAE